MSTKEKNKALIRHFYKSINEVNHLRQIIEPRTLEVGIKKAVNNIFTEFYTHNCCIHDTKGDRSLEDIIEDTISYFTKFSGFRTTVEEMIAEANKVVTRWTMYVTYKDILLDITVSDKQHIINGTTISRMEKGKVVEEWVFMERPSSIQQFEALPSR